jgi:hypothetical protein
MTSNTELLQRLLYKPVKITWTNGYYLFGKITEVSDDFIVFETTTKRSTINRAEVRDIMEV